MIDEITKRIEGKGVLDTPVASLPDAVKDDKTPWVDFPVQQATGSQWRLVYDNGIALALVEGTANDKTSSIYTIEEFNTGQAARDRANELGLDTSRIDSQ